MNLSHQIGCHFETAHFSMVMFAWLMDLNIKVHFLHWCLLLLYDQADITVPPSVSWVWSPDPSPYYPTKMSS